MNDIVELIDKSCLLIDKINKFLDTRHIFKNIMRHETQFDRTNILVFSH